MATLSGTKTVTAVRGTATFDTLSIDKARTGYTLGVSAAGVAGATSGAFNITIGTAVENEFGSVPLEFDLS